jgi:hypothetical protein
MTEFSESKTEVATTTTSLIGVVVVPEAAASYMGPRCICFGTPSPARAPASINRLSSSDVSLGGSSATTSLVIVPVNANGTW